MNNNTDAIAIWRARVQERPESVAALTVLFRAEYESGLAACAERTARRICELRPENADWHCTHGIVLLSLGRIDDSLESLRRAHALCKDESLTTLITKTESLANEVKEVKKSVPAYAIVTPLEVGLLESV